jgi:hypothetical protein
MVQRKEGANEGRWIARRNFENERLAKTSMTRADEIHERMLDFVLWRACGGRPKVCCVR